MSEFSDQADSPTAFLFENLHDVEELLVFDEDDESVKVDEVRFDKKVLPEAKKVSDEKVSSPEVTEIEPEVEEVEKVTEPEKSGLEISTEKTSPTLIESVQRSTEKSDSMSTKKSNVVVVGPKLSSPPKPVDPVVSSFGEVRPKFGAKKETEKLKPKSR